MNTKKKIFIISMPIIMAICSLFLICDYADAATRATVRAIPASRKSISVKKTVSPTQQQQKQTVEEQQSTKEEEKKPEPEPEPIIVETNVVDEPVITNKSDQFDDIVSEMLETATPDNSFAEQIRRQRAALAASESVANVKSSMKNGKNICDNALRQCMKKTCGDDFTKCALDGDTIFGDKLNRCRRDVECTGEEFKLFTAEIKADRDMNVKLSSYNAVINCGGAYNACLMNECGSNFDKCLGKTRADAAIQKCSVIARDCMEYDSGLTSRFNTAIARLRENAEKEIKKDEEQLYKLRELIANQCTSMGAMFDERTFDCVYTVNFYTGEDRTLTASRKRYAGDTFICMQEWFGVNATTYKENAYRETRAQTAASSAMLGSGLGTTAGLISSNAIGRALDTQKAKKAYKEDCENNGTWKNGKCDYSDSDNKQSNTRNENTESETGKQNNDSTSKLTDLNPSQIMQQFNPDTEIPDEADPEASTNLEKLRQPNEKLLCFSDEKDVCEYLDVDYYTVPNNDIKPVNIVNAYAVKDKCFVDENTIIETDNFTYVPCNADDKTIKVYKFPNNQENKPSVIGLFCLMYNGEISTLSTDDGAVCKGVTETQCASIDSTVRKSLSVRYEDDYCIIGNVSVRKSAVSNNISSPVADAVKKALTGKRDEYRTKEDFYDNLQQSAKKQLDQTQKLLDKNNPNRFAPIDIDSLETKQTKSTKGTNNTSKKSNGAGQNFNSDSDTESDPVANAVKKTLTSRRDESGQKNSFSDNLQQNMQNINQQQEQNAKKQLSQFQKILDRNNPNRFLPN